MQENKEECKHFHFNANVNVFRLTETEGGEVANYSCDVDIKCVQCGIPFEFIGVPCGDSKKQPMSNIDFTKLRAPIRPYTNSMATEMSYNFSQEEKIKDENRN